MGGVEGFMRGVGGGGVHVWVSAASVLIGRGREVTLECFITSC